MDAFFFSREHSWLDVTMKRNDFSLGKAVWSSEEQCVEVLCVEMEKLCRRSNSICDILETVLAILDSSSQQNKMSVDDEEDYDDDDDCDDDDYYASGDDEAVPRSSS